MTSKKMTVIEVRKELFFNSQKYTVIGADERTNGESRKYLYSKDAQSELLNVIDKGSHFLIW